MPEISAERPLRWTVRRRRAAQLVAEDEISDAAIARQCGITDRTLRNWKHYPGFAARVAEHIHELGAQLDRYAIARRDKRMAALNDRWEAAAELIDARATQYAKVPGGKTGLIVRQIKVTGAGEDRVTISEYAADTALMSEMRQMEKQAAQEAGQWSEKATVAVDLIRREYVGVDPDDV